MAPRKQGDQHLVQRLALADDDLAHFGQDVLPRLLETGDDLFGPVRGRCCRGLGRGQGLRPGSHGNASAVSGQKYKIHVPQRESRAILQEQRGDPAVVHDNAITAALIA